MRMLILLWSRGYNDELALYIYVYILKFLPCITTEVQQKVVFLFLTNKLRCHNQSFHFDHLLTWRQVILQRSDQIWVSVCIYIIYIYVCNAFGPGGGHGMCSRWRPNQIHGCHLCTSGTRKIRVLDKLITLFYPGRLTADPT